MTELAVPADLLEGATKRELLVMEKLLQIREARLRFALDCHRNTRGESMQFDTYPHIRDLYQSVAPCIVLQGSVQSMKSEWAIVDHFACAFVGLNIFFVVPKYEARTTYVQNRVNKRVEEVDEYKRIIGAGFFDSVAIKSFGNGVIKYVGSNVLADFKEFPADMIIVEEVDECDADNVEYALDRLRASPYQFRRYLGNPKFVGRGINKYFELSDKREWCVPCLECGEYSELDWFEVVVEEVADKDGNIATYRLRDTAWEPGCRRDVHMICPECGGQLERASVDGNWVPTNPGASYEGYHISMLCSPINPVSGMWDRFQKAIHDPLRLQQFYNSDLGLPYTGIGYRVTEVLLDKCTTEGYQFVSDGAISYISGDCHPGPCSMGVDVGGMFDVRISHVEPSGRRAAVFIGKVKTLDELYDLIDRYHVEVCVMDSMPETLMSEEFQATAPCDVWLCRYAGEGSDRRLKYNSADSVVSVDRTVALDRTFSKLKAGKVLIPENHRSLLRGAFTSEMCGPVREMIEDAKGNTKYEWTKCKDHQRHADVYDELAAELMLDTSVDFASVG